MPGHKHDRGLSERGAQMGVMDLKIIGMRLVVAMTYFVAR